MKIGILTQPLRSNYGGILQAYALQSVLENMGHEVLIIDRKYNKPTFSENILKKIKFLIKKYFLKRNSFHLTSKQAGETTKNLQLFIDRYIHQTEAYYTTDELNKILKYNLEAYIVGSDQVWRPMYSPCIYNYFIDFQKDIKKISYAASFGTSDWEYTGEQTKICARLIQDFTAVSVREDYAIEMCKKHLNRSDAVHVLDPTMLLDTSKYVELFKKSTIKRNKGDLLIYILDMDNNKETVIEKLKSKHGYKPFYVNVDINDVSIPFEERIAPPIEEWVKGFYDASFVFTDSFHACVFSILFNKPFIVYGNEKRGMARFYSLLKMFNLEDRLILSLSELNDSLINTSIDWHDINRILEEKKIFSVEYLTKALEE